MPRGPIAEYLDWAAWSPDGRRIYFAGREASDVRRTYVQDVDGGEPRPVTPDGFVGLLLSPDGRTMAAVDRYGEYYLCPVDGGADPRPLPGYWTAMCCCSGAPTADPCSFVRQAISTLRSDPPGSFQRELASSGRSSCLPIRRS